MLARNQHPMSGVRIYPIRHHGPGSAARLLAALRLQAPDCILIEGPPDGDALLGVEGLVPPVALLIYPESQERAAFYPFAVFSPEWVALRYAREHGIPVRFCDLPQAHQMAGSWPRDPRPIDPIEELGGEEWWERLVEQQHDHDIFEAICEAMGELRVGVSAQGREALREAWMRRTLRQEMKAGRQQIAVVCGAWHAPALRPDGWPPAKADDALLKGLAKVKVSATWIPWTYDRLAFESGYGAGVDSPEYYHLLWEHPRQAALTFTVRAAQLLRSHDLQASTASATEAVRLAEALAGLRGKPLPGLEELLESARTVLTFGADSPMQLIRQQLVIGQRMGEIPPDAPLVPLARDVAAWQKRLRLPISAAHSDLELDLRKPNERERSKLFHRLNLLGIAWAEERATGGLGTFKEGWRLQWQPEFALELVRAARWGNTVEEATVGCLRERAASASLLELSGLAEAALLAALPEALDKILSQLQARAAQGWDPAHLLETLPALGRILRYPDVRGTDVSMLVRLLEGLLERVAIGLPLACASLDDEAAGQIYRLLLPAHQSLRTLDRSEWLELWAGALGRLENAHGLVSGRAAWLLLEMNRLKAAVTLSRALSHAAGAAAAAAWVEGFLRDHGELLVHTPELLEILDEWLLGLDEERFLEVLPLLRRTFATFPPGVRRNLGQALQGRSLVRTGPEVLSERAEWVQPVLRRLLGLSE